MASRPPSFRSPPTTRAAQPEGDAAPTCRRRHPVAPDLMPRRREARFRGSTARPAHSSPHSLSRQVLEPVIPTRHRCIPCRRASAKRAEHPTQRWGPWPEPRHAPDQMTPAEYAYRFGRARRPIPPRLPPGAPDSPQPRRGALSPLRIGLTMWSICSRDSTTATGVACPADCPCVGVGEYATMTCEVARPPPPPRFAEAALRSTRQRQSRRPTTQRTAPTTSVLAASRAPTRTRSVPRTRRALPRRRDQQPSCFTEVEPQSRGNRCFREHQYRGDAQLQ